MSIFAVPQAPTTPQADPDAINHIRARTSFGMLKAVVGSQHAFQQRVKRKIAVQQKDGKAKDIEVEETQIFHREVRSLHQFSAVPRKWICLSCDIKADTEEDIIAAHYAVHGGPQAMAKAGLRHVYCGETLAEVDVFTSHGGQPIVRRETALVSDREPGEV